MAEFEVHERDLLGRIGKLKTKSGTVETPAFLPVINIAKQTVSPKELWDNYGCRMLITNAYLIKKNQEETAKKEGIHRVLDFPGVVMTDSGAYQILAYGKVEVDPAEIVRFQEEINTDIATILDLPTGWKVSRKQAHVTVEETIKRAKHLEALKTRDDIAWVGPVQGGRYLDLVALSAREMGSLPFDVYALGSPTPVMEQYRFDLLVDMVLTAKRNLPSNRPLHLFGAGHPFMFALAVALGCDMFDSAAYSLFAQTDRYLTSHGTTRIQNLEYLPCSCPVCAKMDPEDLVDAPEEERRELLTKHNLYVCFKEMRMVKQAIAEGRLWEHLEMRAHGHPTLLQALKRFSQYSDYIERHSPVTKRSGLFFFSHLGLSRPEVVRHRKRLFQRYTPPENARILILLPDLGRRHVRRGRWQKRALAAVLDKLGAKQSVVHVCVYAPPFGVIPTELRDIYPLSQYEYAFPPDRETVEYVANQAAEFAGAMKYEKTVMLVKPGTWQETAAEICRRKCVDKGVSFEVLSLEG